MRAAAIGFIGLGRMGAPMAANLFSKRLNVALDDPHPPSFFIHDAIPSVARAFQDSFRASHPSAPFPTICPSPADVARNASTIITMLPSTPHVHSVYLGQHGLLDAFRSLSTDDCERTVLVDSTTLNVDAARQVAAKLSAVGPTMVDAPVSGGVSGANAATLAFLVGGSSAAFDSVLPLLSFMGSRVIHCGPSGAGLAAKICNNLMLGVQQIAAAEALLLGQKLGLDPAVLSNVITNSTGACWSVSVNNPVPGALPDKSPPCERDYHGGFATQLMLKDMGLACESAAQQDVRLPLGRAAESLYRNAIDSSPDLANKDFSSIYTHLEQKSK